MTEIIGNWLMNSVGCNIKCTPETLGQACYDGKLFAQILVTYNVCSTEYLKLINETVSPKVALSNLKNLCIWFKLLGISITDQFLNEIVNKSGSACLRLLYELFIRLENRESMYYMDSKKKSRILSESTDKFHVTRASDVEPELEITDEKQYLRDLLKTMKGVMQSAEKANIKRFLLNGLKRRVELMKKQIIEDKKFYSTSSDQNSSWTDLEVKSKIIEFEEVVTSPEGIDNKNQQYGCKPEDYISYLKLKRRKEEADKKLKQKLERSAMQDAWKKILGDQEMELKNILCTKLLKQSDYEKQMTLRLQRIRLKYKKFIDNRNMIMDIADKQETVNQFKSRFISLKNIERSMVEKQRIKELHTRLFRERMRLKKLMDYEACRTIVEDVVDIAMVKGDYFENNGLNMPKAKFIELKVLFIKGIRILPHVITPKIKTDLEGPPIKLDDDRLIELADCEFHLYMFRLGPWFLGENPEEDPEQLNIIGFIVHRLLDLKYNFNLAASVPADLPTYDYKIFLQQINDNMATDKLKQHLSRFKIEVIDVSTVINYFLSAYKTNVGIGILKKSVNPSSPLNSNLFSFTKPQQSKVGKKERVSIKTKLFLDKSIQFPSVEGIGEDKKLSDSAKLGKNIYDIIQRGGLLPDAFVCSLIIEYLKTLKDVKGWILLNYPENITQIAILEYMFSGLEVPYMSKVTHNIRKLIESQLQTAMKESDIDVVSLNDDDVEFESEKEPELKGKVPLRNYSIEELIKLKNSNILPKPNLPTLPPVFESFFTNVVTLHHELELKKTIRKPILSSNQIINEEDKDQEDEVTLENFYVELGVNSYFSYKNFDSTTLKRLQKFILSISSNQPQELFKKMGTGVDTPVTPEKKKALQVVQTKQIETNDWLQKMFSKDEEGLEEMLEEEGIEDEGIIYPGHKDWEYTELPVPEVYANILATVWESIEYFFMSNLKGCFGLLRCVGKRLMPYRNYIRKKAEECLNLNDDRTQAVTNFQLMLNGIDDHHRSIDTMKNELHCRTLKLQCDLWKMTDVKKFYCEQVMELIKKQNWIRGHLINVLRVYSFVLQVEADRYADTMQLIEDYYSVCILGYPLDERLMKLSLPKIGWQTEKKNEMTKPYSAVPSTTSSGTKKHRSSLLHKLSRKEPKHVKSVEDGNPKFISNQNIELKTGLFYSNFEMEENPVLSMLQTLISRLKKSISFLKSSCYSRHNLITEKFKEHIRNISDEEGQIQNENKTKVSIIESLHETMNKVFLEWTAAMDYETKRVLYRIYLIEKRASADITEDTDVIERAFNDFERDIISLYHHQILNIDKVCDLMRAAIEEETGIQPLVLLGNDTLDIDPSVILYPYAPPPPPPSLKEDSFDFKFTISQLTNLFLKLVYVAPYGIVERTFVYILEDMACMGHETGHCYLPYLWSSFSSNQIRDIVNRLFGDKTIIDWRHFIIFGLDLGYPTLENILEMKKCFRVLDTHLTETVTYEQYSCVFLWFENAETRSISQDLYYAKAKELLFKVFEISENLMNYTEFLLAFCRDVDPREGFVKALALAEGCGTVAWKQDLFRETFQIENENEKYNVACGILTLVMAGVFQIVDSVIITDVTDEERITLSEVSFPPEVRSISPKVSKFLATKSTKRSIKKRKSTYIDGHAASKAIKSDPMDGTHYSPFDLVSEENEEGMLEFVENEKPEVLWKSDAYFSTVFSLFMLEIHHFALSSDQIYDTITMEENLRKIFNEKGTGHSIKLFNLLSCVYVQKLFSCYRCFQAISLSQLLTKLWKDIQASEQCPDTEDQFLNHDNDVH